MFVFTVGMSTVGREGLDGCLEEAGISAEHFEAAGACRSALVTRPCHLLVVSLDGSATEGLQLLSDSEPPVARIPKLALVDRGDIPAAVQAIRAGAVNCLERTVDTEELFAEIETLLRQGEREPRVLEPSLTKMETAVLRLILKGKTNPETARALHRSPRTIEVHRRHIMRKLGAATIVDLVKRVSAMKLIET